MSPERAAILHLKDLRFGYTPDGSVVRDVSLDIAPGAFHCLLGRSGCGKTSLLKLAAGLLTAQQGQVKWRGEHVTAPLPDMGFVFQRPTLLEWLDATDNVLLPVSLQRTVTQDDRDKARHLLTRMGLEAHRHHRPSQLSGGQQSRVAIARALINDPAILFMDEPFASLDAITREELQHDLLGVCAQQGTSVLFVTHDIAEAVYLSDQVTVMHRGLLQEPLPIDLPRPRHNALRHSPEFNALCAELRQTMEGLA